jgi:hypothetical protein
MVYGLFVNGPVYEQLGLLSFCQGVWWGDLFLPFCKYDRPLHGLWVARMVFTIVIHTKHNVVLPASCPSFQLVHSAR